MSGFFGVFNRNGRPVEEKTVNTMLDAISYWNPDDRGVWIDGSVALGHGMLWNTPESKYEHLPLKEDAYVLSMDARIDNRDELEKEIELPDIPLSEIGDSEFILGAYKKWGEDCPKHLLGDFAFSIWDEKKQQLFCAGDHVGVKQFYYHLDNSRFVFSNDLRGVLSYPDITKKISDKAVAIYLTVDELLHPEITFFESIYKLPPATTMIVTQKNVFSKVYWKAENSPQIRCETLEEYAETLRVILEDAVKKRLRSEYPIASHLSGGLDSSTIATISARHLHMREEKLYVYNWVPTPKEDDDFEHYEWSNSHYIAESENIELSYIDLSAEKLCDILLNHDIAMGDTADLWYEFLVREKAKKRNIRTMLSGWGGDELITYGARAYYSALIHDGKIIDVIKEIYKKSKKSKNMLRGFISQVYYHILVPFLPRSLYCILPKIECGLKDYLKCATIAFAKKVRSMTIHQTVFKMKSLRQDQIDLFNQGHIMNRIDSWASSGFRDRIEYAYPLLDKRIIEFSLGIPSDLYYQKGKSRYLFRYSTAGILPNKMQWGSYKHEPNRVKLLCKTSEDAIKLWLEKIKGKEFSSDYIEYKMLEEYILSIDHSPLKSFEEKFSYIDTTFLSILALSMDKKSMV